MSVLLPFLALDQPCEQVQTWVHQQLSSVGLRIVQTFDLQVARQAHPHCPCPNHGTDGCNCQLIVLLVYQEEDNPVTLVLHGRDGRTWLSLASPAGQHANHHLETVIRRALLPRLPNAAPFVEAPYETHATG